MHCPQSLYEGTVLGKPRSHKTITIVVITIYQISGQQFSRILIGSRNSEYLWLLTALRTQRKMARCFAKVSEEEIKTALFYPSDLVILKQLSPSGSVKSDGYIPRHHVSRYISTTIHLPFGG